MPENSASSIRKPEEWEVLGVIVQLVGHDRVRVKCLDDKIRICRIPGRMKKKIWLKENDVVLVSPWDFQADSKGDVVYKYQKDEVRRLKEAGFTIPQ